MHRFICVLLLALLAGGPVLAQDADSVLIPPHFTFDEDVPRRADVPSPASVLGYEPGEDYTLHAHMVEYISRLASSSDRVTVSEIGRTYERRPLHALFVTSPDNHARLEDIRTANLKLADPATPAAERAAIAASNPVIVWLSYNVHGNEASSTETAMQVAYRLASATDDETARWLDQTVVIIVPSLNPDGRDRYVNWYRSVASQKLRLSPRDLEHDEPWPGGRTNHYWFDLNRDWVWLVHPESRGRMALYQQWLPQVHTDYHEQGYDNNYFTMPGQAPRNLNLPADYDTWADRFGRANAAAFDAAQVNYFTREAFDFFYPGYGSSYPSLFGGIGMLTEQGGHSRGGRAVTTSDGVVLTLRQRIFDHYETSLATIALAAREREALLAYFQEFFSPATRKTSTTAYLLPDDEGAGYLYQVVDMLLKHGVRVERTDDAVTVRDAHAYETGQAASRSFPAGTFVIPTDQPRHIFVETLMQRQMVIEDSVMYDMATWSIPLAYNLDAAWTETPLRVARTPVTTAPALPTGIVNGPATYAYVVDWNQREAPRALARLWELGYRVRFATKSFTFDGVTYPRGSLIVLLGRNRERAGRIHADMVRVTQEAHVRVAAFNTGRMDAGIDLASSDSRPLTAPRVALLVDEGASSYTAGQLWFLFDQWTGFGIDRLRTGSLSATALDDYDVLLMPGGNYSSVIDSSLAAHIGTWVALGGTLVATESAVSWAMSSGIVSAKLAPEADAAADKDKEAKPVLKPEYYTRYEAREDSSGLRRIPGSAMLGRLDDSHPLAFGIGDRVYSLKFDARAIVPAANIQTVGWYAEEADDLLVSGYASAENLQRIAGHGFAAVQNRGGGRVVLLSDNTQYRLFWVGPARLVQNAVMLMPGM